MDKHRSEHVLAEGIREAYSDLFAVNKEANALDVDGAYNKLRTLYKGGKKDTVVKLIAKTFVALCEQADFTKKAPPKKNAPSASVEEGSAVKKSDPATGDKLVLDSLQYHVNIVLPDTRDQAVYDAIFKSLRDHLG